MNAYEKYYAAAREQLEKVYRTQRGAIEQAATWLGEALVKDRWLYAFGTGHSEDLLMLHKEAIEATYLERREGYAAELLKQYPAERGDVLIVASNSGRNAVPIELAMAGTQRGMKVIVITNLAHTRAWPSRHSSGKKLADVGDVVIDNCGVHGDACLELPGIPAAIGPTSSITGMFIVNAIVAQGIENALSRGVAPEIYISSNSNGDEHNDKLLRKYKSRIRHL
ncbi:MAG: hypothetical protein DME18_14915 [Verrucomicrobia bacterium]|nr:MAG: hypothetical protein DME18_14915 [Verrucomicrobiota bacterium]